MSSNLKKSLVLTGMMGVGKTTIGSLLSNRIGIKFVDMDTQIEKKLSLSINDIFKTKGEKYFREIEEKETIECLKNQNLIIALGGGAFLNEKIRDNIKKICISVWLDLDPKTIFDRTKVNNKRPLLGNIKSDEELNNIYKLRKKVYSLADYRIDCNSKTKDEIIVEIAKIYENN